MTNTTAPTPTSPVRLETIDDLLLGVYGALLPPSQHLDHAIRFLSTWSGSDKLMMTAQFFVKLIAPLLLLRAQIQHRAGKRKAPTSPTTDALFKFAGQLSVARRASGLWGILAIIKALSSLERARPSSRLTLNVQRLQGISMLVYYPLEYISFFTSPWAPLLTGRINKKLEMGAGLWSVRAWGVYTLLMVGLLGGEWVELGRKETKLENGGETEEKDQEEEEELSKIKKRKKHIVYQFVANLSRLPVILHWSTIGGIYNSEVYTNGLSLISAVASLRGGWEATRVTPPKI